MDVICNLQQSGVADRRDADDQLQACSHTFFAKSFVRRSLSWSLTKATKVGMCGVSLLVTDTTDTEMH